MNRKINFNAFLLSIIYVFLTVVMTGCKEETLPLIGSRHALIMTDLDNFEEFTPETIIVDSSLHEITLRVCGVVDESMPLPKELSFSITEWDDKSGEWLFEAYPEYPNQPDDDLYVYSDTENGRPVIKIRLLDNPTDKIRKFRITVFSDVRYNGDLLYGLVELEQSSESNLSEIFSLKAKYKDRLYTTQAKIDSMNNYIFFNEEYENLMLKLDTMCNINMMLLDNNTIYYYDKDDIQANKPYEDVLSLDKGLQYQTRGYGFDGFDTSYLGFFALYDNDNFGGSNIKKGLTNLHYTWNLPSLKPYGLNDKVTSIAVAYEYTNPLVCSVLTIWDDTDYNNGDNYRSKHRISIIASRYSPRVTCENLKKIKKIGSSKSWNDCISSISFHFGYLDCLLLDY